MSVPFRSSSDDSAARRARERKRPRQPATAYDEEIYQARKRMRQQEEDQLRDPSNHPPLISPVSAEYVSSTLYYADRGEQLMTAAVERVSYALHFGVGPTSVVQELVYENYRDILVAMQWFPKQYEDKFTIFLTYLLPNQVCTMYKIAQMLRSTEAADLMIANRRADLSEARLSTVPLLLPPMAKSIVMDFDGTLGMWVSEGEPSVASLTPMWPPTPLLDAQGRKMYFLIRPGWEEFVNAMGEMGVEMYAMTASGKPAALAVRAILQWKRNKELFKELYVIDEFRGEPSVKDIRHLFVTEDKIRNALLVDDNAADVCVPQASAFPVTTWKGDPRDRQLYEVVAFFRANLKKARNMQALSTMWREKHPRLFQRKT
jgi:hypothetical protein